MATDDRPRVALLFDDADIVAQVRAALDGTGARIVYEGALGDLSAELLHTLHADVLVINLDDRALDELDRIDALLGAERPRLVFNDPQVSAGLTGWDRARWTRHLVAKVLESPDFDPPRPVGAPEIEPPVPAARDARPEPVPEAGGAPGLVDATDDDEAAAVARRGQDAAAALSAELEALLASEAAQDAALAADDAGAAATAATAATATATAVPPDDDLAELLRAMPDGDAAADDPWDAVAPAAGAQGGAGAPADTPPARGLDELLSAARPADDAPAARPIGDLTTLELVDLTANVGTPKPVPAQSLDDLLSGLPSGLDLATDDAPAAAAPPPAVDVPEAPAEWALVDDDALTPATFGVEKMTAGDYLAPPAAAAADDTPVVKLELVSMEEAVAPRPVQAEVEMHLDELHTALSRLILTGCTLGGAPAAAAFYAALPAATRLTFVHTQHLRGQSADDLVAQLAAACPLPVRLASAERATRPGEVLVVPPGSAVHVFRDGRVELRPSADEQGEPSIDASFRMAAEGFGRDVVAVVFSGHGTDSVAGAKAVHAAGGQVWVETTPAEYADMVNEIAAAGVVDFSASPRQLAAHLVEVSS